jgi:hypothetical protein
MASWKRVILESDVAADAAASVADGETGLVTGNAVFDYITNANFGTGTGDITAVTAGAGLTGGATTGGATLNVIGGDGITVGDDEVEVTVDGTTIELSNNNGSGAVRAKTAAIADGGTGLATADQIHTFVTGFNYTTNVGDITSVIGGTNVGVSGGSSGDATVNLDAALVSMTSMAGANGSTTNQAGTGLTIAGGAGVGTGAGGSILLKTSTVSTTSGTNVSALETAVTIAGATANGGDTTVTIHGDLVVNGATSSIDVQTLTVEDASILLADGANSVGNADGAGLTVDTVTATPANHPNFIWKDTNLGVAGWQFKDHGAAASAGSAPMGVAALTKGAADPDSSIMPTGSMWYNTGDSGTKGLYLYLDA